MTKAAAHSTPPLVKGETPASRVTSPQSQFLVAAGTMSWQLAIVVLLPLLGGFKLDDILNTSPWLTIAGFVVAMAGMALVVRRQLQLFNPKVTAADIQNAKRIRDEEDDDE